MFRLSRPSVARRYERGTLSHHDRAENYAFQPFSTLPRDRGRREGRLGKNSVVIEAVRPRHSGWMGLARRGFAWSWMEVEVSSSTRPRSRFAEARMARYASKQPQATEWARALKRGHRRSA